MRRKLLWQISAIMVLVALLSSTAASAAPAVDRTASVFPPEYHQPGPGGVRQPAAGLSAAGGGAVNAQAIALGKPGTTFRYDKTIGTSTVGYLEDNLHINGVAGLTTDPDGNVYTVEENGARLMKLSPGGNTLWQAGGSAFHDWGANGLNWPRDVLYASDMVIVADSDHLVFFDPESGQNIGNFPSEPWNATEEFRFFQLRGLAVDEQDPPHLYVSDQDRHRITVYQPALGGLVYQGVIGVTDEPGDDDEHFRRPSQVEVIGDDLYVADTDNARVQKCTPNDDYTEWTCETFHGGAWGSGDGELQYVYGLGDDGLDNLYITDNANGRVLKCPTDGSDDCDEFVSGLWWPTDIAFRPGGNALISVYDDFTIKEFTSVGDFVKVYKGIEGVPYLTDDQHYNMPTGVDVDAKGNVYVTEQGGALLTKLSSAGVVLKKFGVPGMPWGDPETHLNNGYALAVDKTGKKLYVVGGSNVRIYDTATLDYLSTFHEGDKDDRYMFFDASGIVFDTSGNFYIADMARQRVMMYNKLGVFVRQLGVTEEPGMANDHFSRPAGLGTDKSGNLYVADQGNCRVQKFDKKGNFVATIGTSVCGDQFDQMGGPSSVVIDSKGNIYVSEEWSNRVNVYDKNGAYLASIAGEWGDRDSQMRGPTDLALDAKGSLYVADRNNNRIQKFLPGVPYAAQVSLNGFGRRYDGGFVSTLGTFKGQLFAGRAMTNSGAQIMRLTSSGWETVMSDAFGDGANRAIDHLLEYKGYLYASTWSCANEDCTETKGGQMWRSMDGLTWMPVTRDGFGDPENNSEIFRMAVLGGKLCASTWTVAGSELWCSASGDPQTWVQDNEDGFGDPANIAIMDMLEGKGALFASTWSTGIGEVWRKVGTGPWTRINSGVLGGANQAVSGMELFNNYLYVITNASPGNTSQIWRCQKCDGSAGDWEQVGGSVIDISGNRSMPALEVVGKTLYAVIGNEETGLRIYKTTNGTTWTAVSVPGFGNSGNSFIYWDNAVLPYKNALYLGVYGLFNDRSLAGSAMWKVCASAACK